MPLGMELILRPLARGLVGVRLDREPFGSCAIETDFCSDFDDEINPAPAPMLERRDGVEGRPINESFFGFCREFDAGLDIPERAPCGRGSVAAIVEVVCVF